MAERLLKECLNCRKRMEAIKTFVKCPKCGGVLVEILATSSPVEMTPPKKRRKREEWANERTMAAG